MKRGKDDEVKIRHMFPTIHVNDTGKGRVRAPPRNKMALYDPLNLKTPPQGFLDPNPKSGTCINDKDNKFQGNKTRGPLQWANGGKGDASYNSMVDCRSGLNICRDDVTRILGGRRFREARRAITNQQRVFAVQVFELHRLVNVQRLIVRSPNIFLEDAVDMPQPKLKDESKKPSHKMEYSAENAVGGTSISSDEKSSVENVSPPSNYELFPGNQSPKPAHGDNKTNPWCSLQMPMHKLLLPIMSPFEGLIYKPYPGPGFVASVWGASALPHQGLVVLPGALSFLPPYGMPGMNPSVSVSAVEEMSQFAAPGFDAHNDQLSRGVANFNFQHQSSCDLPNWKNIDAISYVLKFKKSKGNELQGSSARSPDEIVHRDNSSAATTAEGKNTLLPSAPMVLETVSQSQDTDHRTRVIKVVPHNPKSAIESAARIFRSIQEERGLYDSD